MKRKRPDERGSALVLALSLLAIFSILGTCYVRYMNLNLEESDIELRETRAEQLAAAGIHLAAEGLRLEVLTPNQRVQRGVAQRFDFESFAGINHTDSGIVANEMPAPRLATARVTVYDESSRLNINHASPAALETLLGVDANTARKIAASVPRGGQETDKKWFLAVDELLTTGVLNRDQFDLVIPSLLTTYSVTDHASPSRYFNVNEAEAPVLAAVLGITAEQAAQVQAQGPFTSLAALADTVGAVAGLPVGDIINNPALALTSRCFRIVSESRYAVKLDEERFEAATTEDEKNRYLRNSARGRVEAVLLFEDDGSYRVLQWNTRGDVTTSAGPA